MIRSSFQGGAVSDHYARGLDFDGVYQAGCVDDIHYRVFHDHLDRRDYDQGNLRDIPHIQDYHVVGVERVHDVDPSQAIESVGDTDLEVSAYSPGPDHVTAHRFFHPKNLKQLVAKSSVQPQDQGLTQHQYCSTGLEFAEQ